MRFVRLSSWFLLAVPVLLSGHARGNESELAAPWGEDASAHFSDVAATRNAYAERLAQSMQGADDPYSGKALRCGLPADNYRVAWRVRLGITSKEAYQHVATKALDVLQQIRALEVKSDLFGKPITADKLPELLEAMQQNDEVWTGLDLKGELNVETVVRYPEALKQQMRETSDLEANYILALGVARTCEVYRRNQALIAAIIDQYGWPDRERFGSKASKAAWLIVQHADSEPALQKRALKLIEQELAEGRVSLENFAYLWDRVAVNEGRPQRYGTQFVPTACGGMTIAPLEDEAKVDALRAEAGLWPLADYRALAERPCAEPTSQDESNGSRN